MTQEQAAHAAELAAFFMHDDNEPDDQGPYGPGVTARATAEVNRRLGCTLRAEYGAEHESHCNYV